MIILGIDPGLATTGWAIISYRNRNLKLTEYGTIITPAKLPLPLRLKDIFNDLTHLISKYNPDYMAIEKLFFNTNAKTALLVGQARGVVIIAGAIKNLKIAEFTPLQIKLNIVGYGQADKVQIQKMVQTILKMDELPKPDDAADAIAVAITCAFNLKK